MGAVLDKFSGNDNHNNPYGSGVGGSGVGGGGGGGGGGAGGRGGRHAPVANQAPSKLKKPAKKIDRSMIGAPQNFQHTGHIGASDMSAGAGLSNIQQQMQGKGGHVTGAAVADVNSSVIAKAIDLKQAFENDRAERSTQKITTENSENHSTEANAKDAASASASAPADEAPALEDHNDMGF